MKYKVLALTHHSGHSKENSLYALLRSMSIHDQCEYVDVASRANLKNNPFFLEQKPRYLHALRVNADFQYDRDGAQFTDNTSEVNPMDYDVVLMRLPRPISDGMLDWLSLIFKNQIVINAPRGIKECSNKSFLLNFPSCCPPMKLCYSIDDIKAFSKNRDIVLKPLREYGGRGLLKITGDILNDGKVDWETDSYLSGINKNIETEGYLAMRYLKNVKNGDKRLIVVDGEIFACSLRLPAKDSWLCNVALGGKSIGSEPTSDERKIIRAINPKLKEMGILMYGADTLEDDDGKRILSEINVLSVGGFPQAEEQTGLPIIGMTLNKIFKQADETYAATYS